MAKYRITTDQGTYDVTTDDGGASAPAAAAPAQPGFGENLRAGAESFLKTPALPIMAGTAAGLAASGATPLVAAPAAALAGGAGEAARQIGLRAVSSKQNNFFDQGNPDLPQTSSDAAALIGKRAFEQGAAELGGRAIGAVAKPVLNVVGQGLASGAQGLAKIPAEAFARIFKNPAELLTAPGKRVIEAAYGKVGFLGEESISEAAKGATTANAAFIKSGVNELEKPFSRIDPSKLFDARKAVDAEIDQLRFAGGPKGARSVVKSKMARLQQVRDGINEGLDILAGKSPIKAFNGVNADAVALREADALHSAGAAANSFRSLVPRVNVMQSLPRAATAPLVIPAVAGGLTAAAGAAYKAVPALGRAALSAMSGGGQLSDALINALRKNKGR
jgi:hypothetical protein